MNLALILIAFARRFVKQWYFVLRDMRRHYVASYIDESLKARLEGRSLPAPHYLSLADEQFHLLMPRADEQTAMHLRALYRAWGLAGRRQRELSHKYGYRRGAAAIALARMGFREFSPKIARLLRSRNSGVHLAALRALERLGSPEATPWLIAFLPVMKGYASLLATAALASSCRSRPQLLLSYVNHPDPQARYLVTCALAEIATPAIVLSLKQYAKDSNPKVRAKIAQGLGVAGDSRAVPVLREMARDATSLVRALAVEALGKLGDYGAREVLTAALKDPDWRVRRSAATAMYRLWPDPLWTLTTLRRTGDRYAMEAMVGELERQGVVWESILNLNASLLEIRDRSRIFIRELLQIGTTSAVFYAIELHPSEEIRDILLRLLDRGLPPELRSHLIPLLESPHLNPVTRHALERIAHSSGQTL